MGKQATPRNVHTYIKSFNNAFDRYMDYIRRTRDTEGLVADCSYPTRMLFIESTAMLQVCTSILCLLSIVPLKFVFDNDVDVLDSHSEEYAGFVRSVVSQIEMLARLMTAPPFYRLYNNKLSQDFVKNVKVCTHNPHTK